MRKLIILAAALLLGAWRPVAPEGTKTLFSQSFQFDQDCAGKDMVYGWSIESGPSEHQFIRPWTPGDISIRGAELTVMGQGVGSQWWMIGNNADGDTMLFVTGDQRHGINWYPPGTSFQFPGTETSGGNKMLYMDLHGVCASGHETIMLTFYYTINQE